MDPKLSGLDPKLQDAYNRVMSGPTTPPASGSSTGSATPPTTNASTSNPTPIQPAPNSPSISPPGQSTAPPSTSPSQSTSYSGFDTSASRGNNEGYSSAASTYAAAAAPPQQATNPTASASTAAPTQPSVTPTTPSSTVSYNAQNPTTTPAQNESGTVKKKGSGIMPVFAGILIVFMLAAYVVLWIVIFEVEVPILSDYLTF